MAQWNLEGSYAHFEHLAVILGDDGVTRYKFVCKR